MDDVPVYCILHMRRMQYADVFACNDHHVPLMFHWNFLSTVHPPWFPMGQDGIVAQSVRLPA